MIARSEDVMGTIVSMHVAGDDLPEEDIRAALDSACQLFRMMDDVFSTWNPHSPLSRLRSGDLESSQAPPEIDVVVELCERARELTWGWFDPWAMPGGFDPTGLVKGWTAEGALQVLEMAGLKDAMVNAGGDVAVIGSPPGGEGWRIGIRHPWRPSALAGVAQVTAAVATSGAYERGDHLVDPTGRSPSFAASATVTGEKLWLCDALATAVAVAVDEGLEFVGELDGYDAYLIRSDGTEAATDGFPFVPA